MVRVVKTTLLAPELKGFRGCPKAHLQFRNHGRIGTRGVDDPHGAVSGTKENVMVRAIDVKRFFLIPRIFLLLAMVMPLPFALTPRYLERR